MPETFIARQPDETDPVWVRFVDQLNWYSKKSASMQRAYKRVKLGQIVVGGAVPVVAALSAPAVITATLSAIVVVAEGAQQLFQWHANWLTYRATTETLKQEKVRYLAALAPYDGADARQLLAERLDSVVAQSNAQWGSAHQPRELG
ncbi:DUF4231 domain-containing protein [Nocardia sp. NPDC051787]|uniref:DUF4231 domain-containing protein n=1 Tax=Nocardia sp. NPDC051787 TaxID=3155415 RepID=UPI0034339E2F